MAAHVHELRVNHRQETNADTYEFTYRFSGAADYVVHLTLPAGERKVVEDALKNTATYIQGLVEHLSNPSVQRPVGEFSFGDLSNSLTNHCIPAAILRDVLEASTDPLLITTNDPAFPWHLVRAKGTFLGLHRPLGIRAMIPYRDSQSQRTAPPAHRRPRALLIADPVGDREYARHESEAIEQYIRATNPAVEIVRLAQAEASLANVQLYLDQHFDIIHYAGHAKFDTTSGGERGLVLWHEQLLPIKTLHKGDHSAAAVFLNACWGGAETVTFSPDSHQIILPGGRAEGFGIEFARGGARTFLAPLWPVFDGYASDFAIRLYRLLTRGIPFGEALFAVRREVAQERPLDPTWAVYVLYGHPDERLYAAVDASAGQDIVVSPPVGRSQQAAPNAHIQPELAGARAPAEPGGLRQPDSGGAGGSAGPGGGYPLLPEHIAQQLQKGFFGKRPVQFAPDASAALDLAIRSCLSQHRRGIHALDLLTSACMVALSAHAEAPSVLAALGDSPVVRDMLDLGMVSGHTATGVRSADAGASALRMVALLFYSDERDDQKPDEFSIATGLIEALQSTADFAQAAGRSVITTFDIIEALLTDPHGTLKTALAMLVVDIAPIIAQLRAARRPVGVPDASGGLASAVSPNAQSNAQIQDHGRAPVGDAQQQRAVIGADLIDEARRSSLRYVTGWTSRATGHDAPDPRAALLDELVSALTQSTGTPIVLYGAHGSGKWALVEALAYALSITPLPPQVASLARASLIAADSASTQALKGSRSVPLEKFLRQPPVGSPTILALRDLPELLGERDTIALGDWRTALADALANTNIRLVMTSSSLSQFRLLMSGLPDQFRQINVPPASAELAYELLTGHAQTLASKSGVPIPEPTIHLAAEQRSHRLKLAQPGLGLRLLQGAIDARGGLFTTSGVHDTHISLTVQSTLPPLPNNPTVAPLSEHDILEIAKQYAL